jgi:hypothetical protein
MFGKEFWISMLPFALQIVGVELKNKDANTTGADDETGEMAIQFGIAYTATQGNQLSAKRKAYTIINQITGNWLASNPAPTQPTR